jgi:hypothetical protein
MTKLNAILIDPMSRTISEIQLSGELNDYYKHLKCQTFTIVTVDWCGHEVDIFVDDEGLLNDGNEFFVFQGWHQPLAGRALILGHDDEGETTSCPIGIEEAADAIGWVDTMGVLNGKFLIHTTQAEVVRRQ